MALIFEGDDRRLGRTVILKAPREGDDIADRAARHVPAPGRGRGADPRQAAAPVDRHDLRARPRDRRLRRSACSRRSRAVAARRLDELAVDEAADGQAAHARAARAAVEPGRDRRGARVRARARRRPPRLHAEQHPARPARRGDADRLGHRARPRRGRGRRTSPACSTTAAVARAAGMVDDQRGHAAVRAVRADARASAAEPSFDVYSFGVTLYEVVVGQPPFEWQPSTTPASARAARSRSSSGCRSDAPAPPAVPRDPELSGIIARAMAREPRAAVHRRRAGPRAQAVPHRRPGVLAPLLADRPARALGAPAPRGVGARGVRRDRDRDHRAGLCAARAPEAGEGRARDDGRVGPARRVGEGQGGRRSPSARPRRPRRGPTRPSGWARTRARCATPRTASGARRRRIDASAEAAARDAKGDADDAVARWRAAIAAQSVAEDQRDAARIAEVAAINERDAARFRPARGRVRSRRGQPRPHRRRGRARRRAPARGGGRHRGRGRPGRPGPGRAGARSRRRRARRRPPGSHQGRARPRRRPARARRPPRQALRRRARARRLRPALRLRLALKWGRCPRNSRPGYSSSRCRVVPALPA